MSTGHIATARILAREGESIDIKNFLFSYMREKFEYIRVEGDGLSVKTLDQNFAVEAEELIKELVRYNDYRAEDVIVDQASPGPSVSYTFVFSTQIAEQYIEKYIARLRQSGLKASVYIKPSGDGNLFFARVGTFPSTNACYEACNNIFTASFRYAVHGEGVRLPGHEGRAVALKDARITRTVECRVVELN